MSQIIPTRTKMEFLKKRLSNKTEATPAATILIRLLTKKIHRLDLLMIK
jgi:hypothetical protein